MRIAMFTNTYLPHVGGVAKSVATFTDAFREMGHEVLVVAPEYANQDPWEVNVFRVPAIENVNDSGFNLAIPINRAIEGALDDFAPEIIHAHHPFLLGDAAMRAAAAREVPIVFTHHTMYEQYAHYIPVEAEGLRQAVINLAMGFARGCTYVIAPSESIRRLLKQRKLMAPCAVIPTGIDVAGFASGVRGPLREELGIGDEVYMPGHVGRLAPEKNLSFMAEAVLRFLRARPEAHFLIVGTGPEEETMKAIFAAGEVLDRVHFAGSRSGQALFDAYQAMDLFAFTSKSETQGMVLAEAMAAGKPVIACDADAVRDIVEDGENGKLLKAPDEKRFAQALAWYDALDGAQRKKLIEGARRTAEAYSVEACARRTLELYEQAREIEALVRPPEKNDWARALRGLEAEWEIWRNRAASLAMLLGEER